MFALIWIGGFLALGWGVRRLPRAVVPTRSTDLTDTPPPGEELLLPPGAEERFRKAFWRFLEPATSGR